MSIVGLDLAGSEKRTTGFCLLKSFKVETANLYSNYEIIAKTVENQPKIIAIDAPLSLPAGRKSLEDRSGPHFRECDRALAKKSIKFFPITLGPMRQLTHRGITLKGIFEQRGCCVIEVYPGGAQDVLGIARKQRGLEKLRQGLEKLGLDFLNNQMSDHELDAVTCAYVGKLFLEGKAVIYGSGKESLAMPPKPE